MDPFRSADNRCCCPACDNLVYYNDEDLEAGVYCGNCCYVFTGKESQTETRPEEGWDSKSS